MTLVLVLTQATLGICGVNKSINAIFDIKKQGGLNLVSLGFFLGL